MRAILPTFLTPTTSPMIACALMFGCAGTPNTTTPKVSEATRLAAIHTLAQTISRASDAVITTSQDIDWTVGVLPWDRFTLPTFSPNGLHVAVQLGQSPPIDVLCGNNNTQIDSTSVELHLLDPIQGQRTAPFVIARSGLMISRIANNEGVFVESPNGDQGRWIGKIDWATGTLSWIVANEQINAFPALNNKGDLAWSCRDQQDHRFHLVLQTARRQRIFDDGESDWLLPLFVGDDRLRVYQLNNGRLTLVELDLLATDPLRTAISLIILETGATRALTWQIATTNPSMTGSTKHAFYHPSISRMTIWQPTLSNATVALAPNSLAAAPVEDGTWLVATETGVLRQSVGEADGVHLRNRLAIPIATTSKQWTHLMLVPDGNRLQVHAVNINR